MAEAERRSRIYVLAGTNGSGKSSVGGAMFRGYGADYFNPDEATALIRAANPGIAADEAHGGHDIPEQKIRERYDQSRLHLIALLPHITELRLYDNSSDADPNAGSVPRPTLVIHLADRRIVKMAALRRIPDWAKPLVAAAMDLSG